MKNNIAALRRERGFTQEQLADKVGITRQTVIALEQGRYNPSLLLAWNAVRALGAKRIEDVFELPH